MLYVGSSTNKHTYNYILSYFRSFILDKINVKVTHYIWLKTNIEKENFDNCFRDAGSKEHSKIFCVFLVY